MDSHTLRVFQNEVRQQCRMARIAYSDLDRALHEGDLDRVFYSVQSFLVAVGNLSKLFWPPPPRGGTRAIPERAPELRESLGITDDSILKNRDLRNHLEHFDERLEETCVQHIGMIDTSIGPTNAINAHDQRMYLRYFDTTKFAINYRGTFFQLRPLWEAIQQLETKANPESDKRNC